MGVSLLKGRYFTEQDNRQSPEVAIVDDKLAARFWPNESALGKRLRQGASGPWRTVVGVVADAREYEVDAEPPITAYFPVEQYTIGSRFLVVRTSVDAAGLTQSPGKSERSIPSCRRTTSAPWSAACTIRSHGGGCRWSCSEPLPRSR
jgi:hypothetical protein